MLNVEDWAEIRRLWRAEKMPIKVIARVVGVFEEHSEEGVWRLTSRRCMPGRVGGRNDLTRGQLVADHARVWARLDHSTISSTTSSVILETVSLDTEAP